MAGFLSLILVLALVALPISFIKPNIFARFFSATRTKNALILGSIILVSFVGIALSAPVPSKDKSTVNEIKTSVVPTAITKPNTENTQSLELTPAPTKASTPTPTKQPTPTPTKISYPTLAPTKIIYPTATPRPIVVYPTSTPVPNITAPQTSGGFACNCSKTCTQISSCAEAQYLLNSCGCGARDGDNDGIACDGAPLHCQN